MLIPTNRVFHFRELAARVTGLPGIALAVTSDLGIADLGEFGQALFRAPTLAKLLTEFQRRAHTETSMTAFEVRQLERGDISFSHRFTHGSEFELWHGDLYTLQWTIKVIQLVEPAWVHDGRKNEDESASSISQMEPDGTPIEGRGIQPDVKVEHAGSGDPTFDKAVEILRSAT